MEEGPIPVTKESLLECTHNRLFRVCYLSSTFVSFPSTPRDVTGLNHANKTRGKQKQARQKQKEIPVRVV